MPRWSAANTTAAIPYTGNAVDALNIQNALNALTTISSTGSSVTVTEENPGIFLVTFPNAPLASTQTLISPSISSGLAATSIAAGFEGGTEVADGAQIQLQGGITVANEPLTIDGNGSNLEPTEQTYVVSTTTTGAFSGSWLSSTASATSITLPRRPPPARPRPRFKPLCRISCRSGPSAGRLPSASPASAAATD